MCEHLYRALPTGCAGRAGTQTAHVEDCNRMRNMKVWPGKDMQRTRRA